MNPTTNQVSQARRELLHTLRTQFQIHDENVLAAIDRVPRELFVPKALMSRAYSNDALPIDCAQTISQPLTVAVMSQLLDAEPGMSVLEIGTGSGYQAAVLFFMGLRVFTIERHAALLQAARARLDVLKCNVASHVGDGTIGWSQYAPYDRIIVTAGAPEVPRALVKQLTPDGVMVIPVGGATMQRMLLVRRDTASDDLLITDHGDFKFVPLIGREGWKDQS